MIRTTSTSTAPVPAWFDRVPSWPGAPAAHRCQIQLHHGTGRGSAKRSGSQLSADFRGLYRRYRRLVAGGWAWTWNADDHADEHVPRHHGLLGYRTRGWRLLGKRHP